jgi:hypothetical protein
VSDHEHDEEMIRANWHGCEWLGVESFFAPRYGEPTDVLGGLIPMLEEMGVEVKT